MKEWEEELYQYRLSPAPPKKELQEYIELYLTEKEESYLSWFLHYYEPILNTTVMGIVQRYSMYGHFLDLKEACILGILRAIETYDLQSKVPFITYKTRIMWEEIHNYIRTMRTGLTIQSEHEYRNLRNIMHLYTLYQNKSDPQAIQKISQEVGLSEKTTKEILRSGLHNIQFVDFYHKYTDEETEESREDVTCDHTTDPYYTLLREEQSKAIFSAFYSLTYREQEVIRSHLGFCPNCHSTASPKFKPQTFQEIAIQNELTSAQAAENIYHKAIAKMRKELKREGNVYP